jgi:hypothetical protein
MFCGCYTGCFLKNAANRSSVIYCPILINKRSSTIVKKNTTKRLNFLFFSTLTVMSNKCHFVFLNGNIFIYFYYSREFFSNFTMSNTFLLIINLKKKKHITLHVLLMNLKKKIKRSVENNDNDSGSMT